MENDLLLSARQRGQLKAKEFLLSICRMKVRHADPEAAFGFAQEALVLQNDIDGIRGSVAGLQTDKPEAAAVGSR